MFVLMVYISACLQILLKRGADKGYTGIRVYLNRYVVIGYSIFLMITLVNVTLYRYIQLSTGALLESLSYVFVPAMSALVLKEKISRQKFSGIALILCGVAVYALG